MSYSYPSSMGQRLYSMVIFPLALVTITFFVLKFSGIGIHQKTLPVSFGFFVSALLFTFARLLGAYILALCLALPLALAINSSTKAEKILLPLFDVLQSVPVLAFFPVVIAFFVHYNFYNSAAIFILLITMMWSIVFSLVGGLRVIPQDIIFVAKIFKLKGFQYLRRVLLPAVFPYLVTGSLLAWAGGWNIVIVAEVLHTYIPKADSSMDLFGIGSVLVNASVLGHQKVFLLAIFSLVAFVSLLNFFIWQRLLHYAEKFKFE
jgi:NitT/TauT family transport system permease protein